MRAPDAAASSPGAPSPFAAKAFVASQLEPAHSYYGAGATQLRPLENARGSHSAADAHGDHPVA